VAGIGALVGTGMTKLEKPDRRLVQAGELSERKHD
jgi:hypothetical protein